MTNSKYITIHSIAALEDKKWKGITWIIANIPIANEAKALELYGNNSAYYIQYHFCKN